jgi:hypothetical protein
MKIFQKNPESHRNNYLLEVVDDGRAKKTMKKSRIKGGFSHVKRILAITAMIFIVGSSAATGALALNTINENQAQAVSWNPFDGSNFGCITPEDTEAQLGGTSGPIKAGYSGSVAGELLGGMLTPDVPEGTITVLEKYGYFAPTFTVWHGMNPEKEEYANDEAPFIGTGGKGDGNEAPTMGSLVWISNASTSPFFSHGPGDCLAMGPEITVGIANKIAAIPKFLIAATGEVYGWANTVTITGDDSPLKGVAEGVKELITGDPTSDAKGLKDLLFFDFLTPIILVATMGLIWTGLVKRSSIQAAQGALWMIGATIAAVFFLVAPLKVPEVIDNIVGGVSSGISNAFIGSDNSSEFCALPAAEKGVNDGQNASRATRQVKCSLWYSTIYVPWVSGQFNVNQYEVTRDSNVQLFEDPNVKSDASRAGTPQDDLKNTGFDDTEKNIDSTKDTRGVFDNFPSALGAGTLSEDAQSWPYYQMDVQANQVAGVGLNYSEIAYNQIVINDNLEWKNANSSIGAAALSLLSAIGPSIVILSISLTLVGYQIAMLVMIAFAPLFFLMGVAPGWGRRISMRWLEIIVGLLVKRIVLMLFLLVFVKFYMLVIMTENINPFFQIILVAVLAAVAMSQRSRILSVFTDAINFGGNRGIGDNGAAVSSLKDGTNKAGHGAVNVARKTTRASGVVLRNGAAVTRMGGAALRSSADKKNESKNDSKLGIQTYDKGGNAIDKPDDLAAHKNAQGIGDIDTSRLNARELSNMTDADGNVDTRRGDRWVNQKKADQATRSRVIDNDYKSNNDERKNLKNIKNVVERRNRAAQLRREREAIRRRQAELNKDVRRVFGVAGQDAGTNKYTSSRDSNNKKDPLNTNYQKKKESPQDKKRRERERE